MKTRHSLIKCVLLLAFFSETICWAAPVSKTAIFELLQTQFSLDNSQRSSDLQEYHIKESSPFFQEQTASQNTTGSKLFKHQDAVVENQIVSRRKRSTEEADSNLFSCQGMCGVPWRRKSQTLTCDCSIHCSIYKTCCKDFQQVCPSLAAEAGSVYPKALLQSDVVCSEDIGAFVINDCPGSFDVRKSDSSSGIKQKTYVFDEVTGLLFRNSSLMDSCLGQSAGRPFYWNVVIKVVDGVDLNSVQDIEQIMDSSEIIFKMPRGNYKPAWCSYEETEKSFRFSVAVDMNSPGGTKVHNIRDTGRTWETMVCEEELSGVCKHVLCGRYIWKLANGKCINRLSVSVRVTHPPEGLLSELELETFAGYLLCRVRRPPNVVSANVEQILPIDQNPTELFTGRRSRLVGDIFVSEREQLFRIDLIISFTGLGTTVFSDKTIGSFVASYYIEYFGVAGQKYLTFPPILTTASKSTKRVHAGGPNKKCIEHQTSGNNSASTNETSRTAEELRNSSKNSLASTERKDENCTYRIRKSLNDSAVITSDAENGIPKVDTSPVTTVASFTNDDVSKILPSSGLQNATPSMQSAFQGVPLQQSDISTVPAQVLSTGQLIEDGQKNYIFYLYFSLNTTFHLPTWSTGKPIVILRDRSHLQFSNCSASIKPVMKSGVEAVANLDRLLAFILVLFHVICLILYGH